MATSLITLGVKVLSSHLLAPDALNCADDVLRTRLTVLQLNGAAPTWRVLSFNDQRRAFER